MYMYNTAIEIKNLTKKVENQTLLKNVSLKVKKGEIYGLVGENGAGKSTLMKIMFHILKPNAGEVTILGEKVTDNINPVFQKVSTIIETPIFYQNLTVEENLDIHCDYVGTQYKKDINKILTMVGLQDTNHKKVKELSLGMRQRLALGRAILCQPEILVLDEPINGLDPKGVVDVRELLLTLNRELGVTIFISSHIIAELEKIVDTIGIIHGGVFIEEFSMEKAKKENINLETHFLNILMAGGVK